MFKIMRSKPCWSSSELLVVLIVPYLRRLEKSYFRYFVPLRLLIGFPTLLKWPSLLFVGSQGVESGVALVDWLDLMSSELIVESLFINIFHNVYLIYCVKINIGIEI